MMCRRAAACDAGEGRNEKTEAGTGKKRYKYRKGKKRIPGREEIKKRLRLEDAFDMIYR